MVSMPMVTGICGHGRDWVIKAFKENLSYDQFVTWQLAGDLPTQSHKGTKTGNSFSPKSSYDS